MDDITNTPTPGAPADGAGSPIPSGEVNNPTPAPGEGTPAEGSNTPVAGNGGEGANDNNPFKFPDSDNDNQANEPVVPDKYIFDLPEGIQLTDELEKQFTDIAKGAKLTQEQASSLIKLHSDILLDFQRQADKVRNDWADECKKQGLTTPENIRAAKIAIDTFGGGECMQALIESGAAYNPAVQKMLQNIGHLLSEDNAPDGAHAGKETSTADLLFANSKY